MNKTSILHLDMYLTQYKLLTFCDTVLAPAQNLIS